MASKQASMKVYVVTCFRGIVGKVMCARNLNRAITLSHRKYNNERNPIIDVREYH